MYFADIGIAPGVSEGKPCLVHFIAVRKFNLALQPSEEPSSRLYRMKCDGRHPYQGTVSFGLDGATMKNGWSPNLSLLALFFQVIWHDVLFVP